MLTSTDTTADLRALPTRLGRDELIRAFRLMYLSRRIDDREILLKRQNKIFFQISGAGHEAITAAAGFVLRPAHDWFYLYYRDRALCLALGVTTEEMLLGAVGAAADPASGGRQMPSHWGSKRLNIVSVSSPTGTQFLQAVGCADANRHLDPESDAVTLVTTGDGATSEGEFWESLNIACLERLPVIYLVEDNGYAISVPVEKQTAGGDISKLVSGFPDLKRVPMRRHRFHRFIRNDGRSGRALPHAIARRCWCMPLASVPIRTRCPTTKNCTRPKAEREIEARRDPIVTFPDYLISEGILDRHGARTDHPRSRPRGAGGHRAGVESRAAAQGIRAAHLYSDQRRSDVGRSSTAEPHFSGDPRTMVDAINLTLHEEMRRNDKMVVFGEDVADCSREAESAGSEGQGRRLQSHPRPANRVRIAALLQLADRRSGHRRARHRHGDARHEAGGRDSILRLHLAGDDADSR